MCNSLAPSVFALEEVYVISSMIVLTVSGNELLIYDIGDYEFYVKRRYIKMRYEVSCRTPKQIIFSLLEF
jgi:hypothetical protein